jgi:serpin B
MQKAAGIVLMLLCVLFIAGCIGSQGSIPPTLPPASPSPEEITPVPTPSGEQKTIVEANNQFAFDLYSSLSRDPGSAGNNLFFSPFSICSALAITYEGARGSTAGEIRSVLHFPTETATLREGFSSINSGINTMDDNFTLRTANALWAEQTYPFLPSYTTVVERYYRANTTNLDFISQPEDSRLTINHWVEEKTNHLIRDLIPAGAIDALTRLVITNAIYFKGSWVQQFDPNLTANADFHVSADKTVEVPMMQRTGEDSVYRFTETADLQVLELPYAHGSGNGLSMIILLPRENNLSSAEKHLTPVDLADLRTRASRQQVDVYLPRFRLETEYHLPDTLSAMGMPTAFTGDADLSGMGGRKDLFISDVIHKAYVDVNEEGTEAAAATAVIIKLTAIREDIPVFRADHPFLFLIQDDDSGSILFIGRVINPSGS